MAAICNFSLFVYLSLCCLFLRSIQAQSASITPAGSQAPRHIYTSALTFQVEPREETCFYEELETGKQLKLEFEVIRGGLLDVTFKISDPYNNVMLEKLAFFNRMDDLLNEAEGRVEINARSSGVHRVCFDNTMSRWTPKVISFFLIQGNNQQKDTHSEIAKLTHLGPIVDSVIHIADKLDAVESLQHHMRVREQSHRDSIEASNARVQWLSILESIVLVVIAAAQLKYIMNWFQEKHKGIRV